MAEHESGLAPLADPTFRALLDGIDDGVFVLSSVRDEAGGIRDFRYDLVNRAGLRLLGRPEDEVVGQDVVALFPSHADLGIDDRYRDVVATGRPTVFEIPWFEDNGVRGSFLVAASKYRDGVVLTVTDITDRKRAEAELLHSSMHDPLTGLPNRALLMDRIGQDLLRSKRSGHSVAVLFIDLDNFKSVNDTLGHATGDALLVAVGHRLREVLREADSIARLGGDEFVVLCPDISTEEQAALIARRLVSALAGGIAVDGESLTAGASIGVAVSTPDSTADDLLRDADSAMYEAKRAGGGQWSLANDELHRAAVGLLRRERELRHAIEAEQFQLHFQPILAVESERIVAVEALIRWDHPQAGRILPHEFITTTERRGLMTQMGAWIMNQACLLASRWPVAADPNHPSICVNLSARQIGVGTLPVVVAQALDDHGIRADRLVVEISEPDLVGAAPDTVAELRELARMGVRLSVDDFGTGHSGFNYLRLLPVSQIKIDQSLIAGLGADATDTAITGSLVAMGAGLGLEVVAEGVERPEQLHLLRSMGCPLAQGWLWQAATTADTIDRLLRRDAPLERTMDE